MSNPVADNSHNSQATPISSAVPAIDQSQEIAGANEPWRHKTVLSLDGGGIRGYYTLLHIHYLMVIIEDEERTFINGLGVQSPATSSFHPLPEPLHVAQTTTNDGNYLPCHYFDYICGTSTGGLIAIMLSRLRMTPNDCLAKYLELGGAVFGSPRLLCSLNLPFVDRTKYDRAKLIDAIQKVVSKHDQPESEARFQSHPDSCQTFICAFKQNKEKTSKQLYIFRSYDHLKGRTENSVYPRNPGAASTYKIWEVGGATTAASFYFGPLEVYSSYAPRRILTGQKRVPDATFIDGGFGPANNPSVEIYEELSKSNEPISTLVSVGTGRKTADRFQRGFTNQLRTGFDALGDTEEQHKTMEDRSAHVEGLRYFRFNEPDSLKDMDFDEWKGTRGSRTIEAMNRVFNAWALQPGNHAKFRECASQLVRRRRLRVAENISRWECYALGSYFNCSLPNCSSSKAKEWDRRDEFEEHLRTVHNQGDQMIDDTARKTLVDRFRRGWTYPTPNGTQANGRA